MIIKFKEILFIIIMFGVFSTADASHVRWFSNFEDAHKEALKQNKNLMVFLIKKECSDCEKILTVTFMNQPYIDAINEKFISVLITKDQESSYPIEMLYTLEYPTLFFLNKEELFNCETLRGEITPKMLEKHLAECYKQY